MTSFRTHESEAQLFFAVFEAVWDVVLGAVLAVLAWLLMQEGEDD